VTSRFEQHTSQYIVVATVLGFPLEYYENFVREHKYGLATQTFGPSMGDEFKVAARIVGLRFDRDDGPGGALFFVLAPVMNTFTRVQEKEADIWPQRRAPARRLRPGRHPPLRVPQEATRPHRGGRVLRPPSGYNRIYSAMVWKSQNLSVHRISFNCIRV
jgi:hypothetical protein